jgi:transposase, IS5 family
VNLYIRTNGFRGQIRSGPAPDETTILKFRHLLEEHDLCSAMLDTVNRYLEDRGIRIGTGTIVDATIIHSVCSTAG